MSDASGRAHAAIEHLDAFGLRPSDGVERQSRDAPPGLLLRRVGAVLEHALIEKLEGVARLAHLVERIDDRWVAGHASVGVRIVPEAGSSTIEAAKRVGSLIAEAAKAKDIHTIVFDRNGFLYHGRVQAVADGAREAGLEF